MKIVLMVAAGVAVGLTAAMAVLIQVLERLLPIVLVAALVVVALRLARGWAGRQAVTAHRTIPHTAAPTVQAHRAVPLTPAPTSCAASDHASTYLRWGPQVCEDLDVPALDR
ncbi:MAG: hypothetical protein AB7G47_14480 [Mycolicibacterium sp.]|uniref:hypothetical protein n=1 Tax=Mycolicibacterium sp. TaxID=2320850 RepID=UPI0027FB38AF|nr:hypothetical protein [Actinomycetes bacterium]